MNTVKNILEYLEQINLISIFVRVIFSMICGGIIGIERGRSNHPAGMRTYMLVCMGSAMVMMTGQYMFYHFQSGDPARLGAQVVSGIGFLGAGSIITSGKTRIRGLTTAAGLWTAACIGLAIGIGFYEAGIVATIAVSVIMTTLKRLESRLTFDDEWLSIYIEFDDTFRMLEFELAAREIGLEVGEIEIGKKQKGFKKAIINIRNKGGEARDLILRHIETIEGIQFVKYVS